MLLEFDSPEELTGAFISAIVKTHLRDKKVQGILVDEIVEAVAKYLEVEVINDQENPLK